MASAEAVAAVIEAGGAHVPELLDRLELRLAEVASSHGAVRAEHAGATIAAGGKRLRPLLVFVAAGSASDSFAPRFTRPPQQESSASSSASMVATHALWRYIARWGLRSKARAYVARNWTAITTTYT